MSGLCLRHSLHEHTDVIMTWEAGSLAVDRRNSNDPHATACALDTVPLARDGVALDEV